MKKTSRKSNSGKVLNKAGDGGLSAPTRQPPRLQSLAPGDTPTQSFPSPLQDSTPDCTIVGDQQLNSGNRLVLTDKSASIIPNSTLAGTANWVLNVLQKRGLIDFGLVRNDLSLKGEYYQARFSTSIWTAENGVLTLKDEEK